MTACLVYHFMQLHPEKTIIGFITVFHCGIKSVRLMVIDSVCLLGDMHSVDINFTQKPIDKDFYDFLIDSL